MKIFVERPKIENALSSPFLSFFLSFFLFLSLVVSLFTIKSLLYKKVDGVNWMMRNFYRGRGAILADEMGLGKTAQVRRYYWFVLNDIVIFFKNCVIILFPLPLFLCLSCHANYGDEGGGGGGGGEGGRRRRQTHHIKTFFIFTNMHNNNNN